MTNTKLKTIQWICIALIIMLPLILGPFLPSVKDHSHEAQVDNKFYWSLMRCLTIGGIVLIGVLELCKITKRKIVKR
jgi:hypothetical protein